MNAPLIFLDTETTGLSIDDDIWELAAIRRDPDGAETELHMFIEHDRDKCARLPESFRTDHCDRYLDHRAYSRVAACNRFAQFVNLDRPHIVGAVPNFDTERIAHMYREEKMTAPRWHHHLIDVENLAVGYLSGAQSVHRSTDLIAPPWNSDDLAEALGVTIATSERHTAMGDARWAMRIYDVVMGGAALTAPEDALTGGALDAWRIYKEQEHDTGCRIEHESDVPCLTDEDIAELKLQARDYDGWAAT